MITYINKDIFLGDDRIIVHGCNCFCTMGAGIALQIKNKYNAAYIADKLTTPGDLQKLGTYTKGDCVRNGQPLTIVNLYTQYDTAAQGDGSPPFVYTAFERGLHKVLKDYPTQTMGMPKIGAGLAGGDWKVIERIINTVSGNRNINVYVIDKEK